MTASESQIQHDIRLALGSDPRVVLWRNNVGIAEHKNASGRQAVRYGLCVGSSDLIGIVTMPDGAGRFLALEVKAARGTVSPDQRLFLELVRKRGGFSAVVRSPEEARAAIERAVTGANQ